MKRIFGVFVIFCYPFFVCAQNLPGKQVMVTGGYSKHGSSDMKGIVFGAEYANYTSRRVSLNYYFRGSINNATDTIRINNTLTGQIQDGSIRFTTAGVQAGLNVRYSFIRSKRHELLISLGALGRYQSASNGNDGYSLYYPTVTGLPTILVEYNNKTPQKTYSLGGLLQFQYNITLNNNIILGLAPGFQTDTNGDALLQVALVVGKRF